MPRLPDLHDFHGGLGVLWLKPTLTTDQVNNLKDESMTEPEIIYTGMDLASPNGDQSCEVVLKKLPDGTLEVVSVETWKHELKLQANKPARGQDHTGYSAPNRGR